MVAPTHLRRLSALLALFAGACGTRTLDQGPSDAEAEAEVDAPIDFSACTGPGTCLLVPASCCGSCGAATPTDMIGVATSLASAYRGQACAGSACPACFMEQDPFLQSFCRDGACAAINLRLDAMTACAADADCTLRYASCCEPCAGGSAGLLALRKDRVSDYRAEICAPDTACPKCAVVYPAGTKAVCASTGHCEVSGPTSP